MSTPVHIPTSCPIFAGKGVTVAVRHDTAKRFRPTHNLPLFCQEHMTGAFSEWQMIHCSKLIMSKDSKMFVLIAGSKNIVLSDGRKIIRIKLVDYTGPQMYSLSL
jgi:hypothetical protein